MNIKSKITFVLMMVTYPLTVSSNTILPDPTRPATYDLYNNEPVFVEDFNDEESIDWKVSAIRISENDKSAIVNGKLVRVGDEVGPAKVIEIKPLSVLIDHENNKLIVRLFKNQVVKEYKSSN